MVTLSEKQRNVPITPLSALPTAVRATVREVRTAARDADRLADVGVCEGRVVELLLGGDPMVVRVYRTRVGLAARLAAQVLVEPMDDDVTSFR